MDEAQDVALELSRIQAAVDDVLSRHPDLAPEVGATDEQRRAIANVYKQLFGLPAVD